MARTGLMSGQGNRRLLTAALALGLAVGVTPRAQSADAPSPDPYLEFIRSQAAALRAGDAPPASLEAWQRQRAAIRSALVEALGELPGEPAPLEAKTLGTLERPGYRVDKVVFQTLPGVLMTANVYVPDTPGRHPAILHVHGHWRGAKQDPVVQARCIGSVKQGFVVLVVDAMGAGERGVETPLGEYHGALTAATLLPVGLPLAGLQVYENRRAVDYLRTRPDVDPEQIGITGASGGGNQTMYAAALDERLKAAAAVCSVGNYQAYLGAGCCLCELVPGALRFTEEWGLLGLTAPRALLVINASQDAPQFSVAEAKKSLAGAEPVFRLFDHGDHLRHAVFESKHDYNRAMREAMYGWMTRALKGEGDGAPIPEGAIQAEDPETLRCYPGDSRPAGWVTIPKFAAAQGRKLLAARPPLPQDPQMWPSVRRASLFALVEKVLGGLPTTPGPAPQVEPASEPGARIIRFEPEPGIHLSATLTREPASTAPLAIVLDLEGAAKAAAGPLASAVREAGWGLVTLDLRATGALTSPRDRVARVADHNSAEWGIWIGRPLLGQWVVDLTRLLDAVEATDGRLPPQVIVLGRGPAGIVALAAAAIDRRITRVAAVGTLASYVSDVPYAGQRLGVLAPGILRHVGDVVDLAALVAPRRVIVAGAVTGVGAPLTGEETAAAYHRAAGVWQLLGAPGELVLRAEAEPAEVLKALR